MLHLLVGLLRSLYNAHQAKREAEEEKHLEVRKRQLLKDAQRRSDEHAGLRRRDRSQDQRRRSRQQTELDAEMQKAGWTAFARKLNWPLLAVAGFLLTLMLVSVFWCVASRLFWGFRVPVTQVPPPAPVNPPNRVPPEDPLADLPVFRALVQMPLPQSEPGRGALPLLPENKADLAVRRVEVVSPLPCVCWTPDGKGFYTLQKETGVVARVRLDGFHEERRLPIGKKCHWLAVCSKGLVVSVEALEEVWLVDAQTLDVKGRVGVPQVKRVAASPAVPTIIAEEGPTGKYGDKAHVLDMAALKIMSSQRRQLEKQYSGPIMTPDGAYVLTADVAYRHLHRYRISEGKLDLQERSPEIGIGDVTFGICLSPDGKQVAMPTGGGNIIPEFGRDGYSTTIYSTDQLRRPLFHINQGARPGCVAFAPRLKRVYGHNNQQDLITFDTTGQRLREYFFGKHATTVAQLLVHPDETRMLLLKEGLDGQSLVVFHIELPQS